MADDDKKFEGALAGFLHRERRDSERHVFCPEPGLLAAYYDRTLSPEEIQVARLHVEGCSRCQDVLAQLKKTEELPLVATPLDKLDSVHSQALTFPGSATPVPNHSRWRWIAPAGAIAATLVLWLAYQQDRSTKISSSDSVQVAENRREVDVPAPVPQPPVAQSNSGLQGEPARGLEDKSPNKMESAPSPKMTRDTESKARKIDKPNVRPRTGQLSRSDSESKAVEEFSNNSDLSAATVTAQSVSAAPVPANVGSAVPSQVPMADARLKKKMSAQLSAARNSVIIGTAGTAVWRVGPAGSIEISIDGGNNWHAQISGVDADLSAGSAPLANICWVVGRSGTILLTTDSGATWGKIKSPTGKDIAGVLALDASKATVWDVSDEKFETVDGGFTWKRVGSE
jgi:hypothetical protein